MPSTDSGLVWNVITPGNFTSECGPVHISTEIFLSPCVTLRYKGNCFHVRETLRFTFPSRWRFSCLNVQAELQFTLLARQHTNSLVVQAADSYSLRLFRRPIRHLVQRWHYNLISIKSKDAIAVQHRSRTHYSFLNMSFPTVPTLPLEQVNRRRNRIKTKRKRKGHQVTICNSNDTHHSRGRMFCID